MPASADPSRTPGTGPSEGKGTARGETSVILAMAPARLLSRGLCGSRRRGGGWRWRGGGRPGSRCAGGWAVRTCHRGAVRPEFLNRHLAAHLGQQLVDVLLDQVVADLVMHISKAGRR